MRFWKKIQFFFKNDLLEILSFFEFFLKKQHFLCNFSNSSKGKNVKKIWSDRRAPAEMG
jgi:hypothetical protein